MSSEQTEASPKLANLDFLRGVAAFAVVTWHYTYFSAVAPHLRLPGWSVEALPFFALLRPFYWHGDLAVPFFWQLSGYVFFHVYAGRASISGFDFFRSRFARLYPLHLATLLFVAALQAVSWASLGRFQIYPQNDVWSFLRQLIGVANGDGFNGPIWSVAVEAATYVGFFYFLTRVGVTLRTTLTALEILVLVYWLVGLFGQSWPHVYVECAVTFMLGGLVREAVEWTFATPGRAKPRGAAVLCAATFAAALVNLCAEPLAALVWVGFPTALWAAAAAERIGFSTGRAGLFVGSLTYSSYLLHMPILMTVTLAADGLRLSRAFANSPAFFVGYLAAVVLASALCYRRFEVPARRWAFRALARVAATKSSSQMSSAKLAG